jgi:hypothetical protein
MNVISLFSLVDILYYYDGICYQATTIVISIISVRIVCIKILVNHLNGGSDDNKRQSLMMLINHLIN